MDVRQRVLLQGAELEEYRIREKDKTAMEANK